MSSRLYAIVVTYKRPDDIRATLISLRCQSRPPDYVLVVDNSPSKELEQEAANLGHVYAPMHANLGPAGGIAAGMRQVLESAKDVDFVVLIDDDNPPVDLFLLENLTSRLAAAPLEVAAVGVMGARYDRRIGRLLRVADADLAAGDVDVDYLGGNQCPTYRISAVRRAGPFDSDLFFGYEELEYGLRLRTAGYRLTVPGSIALEHRLRFGRIGLPVSANRVRARASWRVYYGARNLVHISRCYGSAQAVVLNLLYQGVARPLRLAVGGSFSEALLCLHGTFDGLFGRLGRRIEP